MCVACVCVLDVYPLQRARVCLSQSLFYVVGVSSTFLPVQILLPHSVVVLLLPVFPFFCFIV